jgi:hypothetical protein
MDYIIHDIKTERQNVSEGLPAALKAVPVAFYVACALSVLLSFYFYLGKKAYEATTQEMQHRAATAEAEQYQHQSAQQAIAAESQHAEAIARWLEASGPLQPVVVAIGRSMARDATIAELSLNRNPELPAHTLMQLKVDGAGSQQIESTLSEIYQLNYQTYSAQQVKARNATDFQATLIHTRR